MFISRNWKDLSIIIYGGRDNGTYFGTEEADTIYGGKGNDTIDGAGGDDFLSGDSGDDQIYTGGGNDLVIGAEGDDVCYYSGPGALEFHGNSGYDWLIVRVDFDTGWSLGSDIEAFEGGDFADTVTLTVPTGPARTFKGMGGNDNLTAGDANDWLYGGDGNDTLSGGFGHDKLYGGAGADTQYGGDENDRFFYAALSDSLPGAEDFLADFHKGERVDVSAIDPDDDLGNGNGAFTFVVQFSAAPHQAMASYSRHTDITSLKLDADGDGISDMIILISGKHIGADNFIL